MFSKTNKQMFTPTHSRKLTLVQLVSANLHSAVIKAHAHTRAIWLNIAFTSIVPGGEIDLLCNALFTHT